MDIPKLSLAARRLEDAKQGRKLIERVTAELDKNTRAEKGRRIVTDKFQSSQVINIRT